MTPAELQAAINDATCLACASLSSNTLAALQLNQLTTIAEAAEAGGEAPPLRYPTLGVANAPAKEVLVKTSAGRLLTGLVQHNGGGDLFLQMHDSSTIPADGAVPIISMRCGHQILSGFDFGASGLPVQFGIVLCISTTPNSKTTAPVAATALFTATYR